MHPQTMRKVYQGPKGFGGVAKRWVERQVNLINAAEPTQQIVRVLGDNQTRYGVCVKDMGPGLGRGLANGPIIIPAGTPLAAYGGMIVADAVVSDDTYVLHLGTHVIFGQPHNVSVDGHPRYDIGLLNASMCNHACGDLATCALAPLLARPLDVWVLEAARNVQPGEGLTWDYNSTTGSFFFEDQQTRAHLADPALAPRVVLCGCNGEGPCPLNRSLLLKK